MTLPGSDHRVGKDGQRGFTFPARVAITVVGDANARLDVRVPEIVSRTDGVMTLPGVRQRSSRNGRFVSVTLEFDCPERAKYDEVHAALRAEPAVRYTL